MMTMTKTMAIALAVAPALLLGGVATTVIVARQQATPAALSPATRAAGAPLVAAKPLTATLPGGVTVTLRGVSEPFDAAPAWWAADGSAIAPSHAPIDWRNPASFRVADADFTRLPASVPDEAGEGRTVEFAVDTAGPGVKSTPSFELVGASLVYGYPAAAPDDERSKPAGTRREALIVRVAGADASATLRVRVDAGEPRELLSVAPDAGRVEARVGGEGFTLVLPRDTPLGTTLYLGVPPLAADAFRLVAYAVDREGREWRDAEMQGVDAAWRVTLRGVPLASIARIVIVGHPRRWVEFRDVSLVPGHMTMPTVVVADGPPGAADLSTPRGAIVTYLRAEDRYDVATMRRAVYLATDDGRQMLDAAIDWALARQALAEAVKERIGAEATSLVIDDNRETIGQALARPESAVQIEGDRATVALDDDAPVTPLVRAGGEWKLDIEAYARLCRSTPTEEIAQARTGAARLNAVTARVRSGEIATREALRAAYYEAVQF